MSSDQFQDNPFALPAPKITFQHRPLPAWLARRVLRVNEQITWVRGPRWNPSWEGYLTHPIQFVIALALGGICLGLGRLSVQSWSQMQALPILAAIGFVIGSVYVLGISNAYFTRLVVTDRRIFILQGIELCRSWRLDDLPRSLLRFSKRPGGGESRTVDLEAIQTMLGGSSEQFAESKTVLKFGKQLDQIRAREIDRP